MAHSTLRPFIAYLPMDRRQALANGRSLPNRTSGAALFADISGFTLLTEALVQELGRLRGAEELTQQLNAVYTPLIQKVHQYGGCVISFSGDAITCWFDGDEGIRAAACALAMQQVMKGFAELRTPGGTAVSLAIKVALTVGPMRRFLVGDETIQRMDVLAGATLDHMAAAEKWAQPGEVVLGPAAMAALGSTVHVVAWRSDEQGARYAVIDGLRAPVTLSAPWPELPRAAFTPEQLRPWLLPPVYERLVAGGQASGEQQFLAELRPAVTLFLRFSGLDYDGDNAAGEKLDAYIRWAQAVLASYEGYLLQLTVGDKGSYFYAAFGAPIAHDDDAARAVAAALELRQPPAEFNYISPPQIGLSQGRMRTGAYGSEARRTYGVLGDEVNISARLMAVAQPGQILLSSHLAELVSRQYECRNLGTMTLKGKATPLPVCELVGRRGAGERPFLTFDQPLVGREADLRQLDLAAERAQAGQGQIVRLQGAAGIGKSHLAAAFTGQAAARGFRVALGACQSTTQGTPYAPWRQILRALLGLDGETRTAEAEIAHVAAQIERLNPDWSLRLPLLGDPLGLPIPDNSATAAFDPRLRQEALFTLVADMIRRWAGERPLLLLLEDVHWLDEVSGALLVALGRALADAPILLLLAQRPPLSQRSMLPTDRPIVPELDSLPAYQLVNLTELTDDGVAALLAQHLGGPPTPLTLAVVQAQAQGNPFFAEELATALLEAGHLYLNADDGTWRLSDAMFAGLRQAGALVKEGSEWLLDPNVSLAVADLGIPDSIHGLVLSRLDRLAEEAKLTLKVASVIGRSFGVALLNHAHPGQPEPLALQEQLNEVAERDFVRLEIPAPQLVYIFKHNTTQDVAYQTLLFAQRRALHRVIAEWYEGTYAGEALAPYFPLLVHHWRQAEASERERLYARLAGEQAAARFANEEAISYFTRALQLLPTEATRERYEVLLGRTAVYHLAGLREEQAQDLIVLQSAADTLSEATIQATVALRFADYYEAMSDYSAAELSAQQAVRWAEEADNPELRRKGLTACGLALWRRGELEAARHPLEEALSLARKQNDQGGEATVLHHLGTVSYNFGNLNDAQRFLEQALHLRRSLEELSAQAASLTNLVAVYHALGDFGRSERSAQEALAIYQKIGDRRAEATVLNNLAGIHHALGHLYTARQEHQQALALYRALDNRMGESLAANNLALVLHDLGKHEEASRYAARALDIDRAIGDKVGQGYSLTTLGLALEGFEQWSEAAAAYEEARVIRQQIGQHSYAMDDVAGLARIALRQNNLATAAALATEANEWLTRYGPEGMEHPLRLYLTLAEVLKANGRFTEAKQLLQAAVRMVHEQAERISEEVVRESFLTDGPLHQSLFKSLNDSD